MTSRTPRLRARPSPALSPRAAGVLRAIVAGYIQTGAAIASEAVRRQGKLDISPATVRVVMNELTAQGLLEQPHASAGRVPTEAGLRVYVDHLVRPRAPSPEDRSALDATLRDAGGEPGAVVRAASRHLAGACTLAAVGRRPRLADTVVDRIELLRLDTHRVLAVCVLCEGEVRNRVLRLAEPADDRELARARNLFNDRWSGRRLSEARRELRASLDDAERRADPDEPLLRLGHEALPEAESPDDAVLVEGRTHLIGRDVDPDHMSAVLAALDDKRLLLHLLDGLADDHPRVVFGGELGVGALRDCTLICAPYGDGGLRGAVAILGPSRMNYSRIIPWVGYTAEAISGILHAKRAA